MPIPVSQLSTWTNQGGTTASSNAYAAIDSALKSPRSAVQDRNFKVFLQGSYRNSTNIYADSDIDVVCVCDETLIDNRLQLPPDDQRLITVNPPATYFISDFHRDVFTTLLAAFGVLRVRKGRRAIHVNTGHGREADVIPAIQYIHYYRALFGLYSHQGIAFCANNHWVYNFPQQHIENGQAKNAAGRTNGRYKPTVRMFKNARNCAVRMGLLRDGDAPSYFIEGLLHSAPDNLFTNDVGDTFVNVFNHLYRCNLATVMSQNGIIPLVGNSPTQWQLAAAQSFLGALRRLWNEWPLR